MAKDDWQEVPLDDWQDIKHHPDPAPGPSALQSGARQFAGGVTQGFDDEIVGGIDALGRVAGVKNLGSAKHLNELELDTPTLDTDKLKAAYMAGRDSARADKHADIEANPGTSLVSNIAGAVASPINKVLPTVSAGTGLGSAVANAGVQGAILGGTQGVGNSESDNIGGLARDAAIGTGIGSVGGVAGGALAHGIAKAAPRVGQFFHGSADTLDDKAGQLAENATGATAAQAEKFKPGAGRELLDRGLVRPFDTAKNIANRVGGAVDDAERALDESLSALDAQGVTASADNVVSALESKIAELRKDPSQAGTVRKLQGIIEDISATGESSPALSLAEQTKRGFRKAAGNWMDPEAGAAGKDAYRAYMGEVERSATDANPELASKFKEAKQTYGLLAPVREAAERRAAQLKQSPLGGFGDLQGAVMGTLTGGPGAGTAAGVVAKRALSPRIASTSAWGMDKLADAVRAAPQAFGRFAGPLQAASQRGGSALAATHFILQQTNEQYREMMRDLQNPQQEQDDKERILAGH